MPVVARSLPFGRLVLPLLLFLIASPILYRFIHQHYTLIGQNLFTSPYTPIKNIEADTDGGAPQAASVSAGEGDDNAGSVSALPHSNFAHTQYFHPKDPGATDYCGTVSDTLVQGIIHDDQPSDVAVFVAYHLHDGSVLTDAASSFPVGASFCTLLFIRQAPRSKTASDYEPLPIEGMGPDAINAEIASPDVRLVFTHHPLYRGQISDADGALAVYTVSFTLNHPGVYRLSASVELRNYDWSMEDPIKLVFKDPDEMASSHEELSYAVFNDTISSKSPPITIQGVPLPRPSQPCYHNGYDDLRGRWYRANAFSLAGNQTTLNPAAHLNFADYGPTRNELGWTFAPALCSLSFFSAEEHLSCFEKRSVQLLGDSNLRRLAKDIISGGDRWCLTGTEDEVCQCRDGEQETLLDAAGQSFNLSRLNDIYDQRETPALWGHNSKLYIDFVGGLVNGAWGNPWQLYYNSDRSPQDANQTPKKSSSIVEERQASHGQIGIVLISLIAWDLAGLRSPTESLAALAAFRHTLLSSYPQSTRFVIRLSQNVCCGLLARRSRFSAPRFQMWNSLWREFWSPDVVSGRVLLHDASLLGGRADVSKAVPCLAPHLLASHVRIEAMMLLNSICEKGDFRGSA